MTTALRLGGGLLMLTTVLASPASAESFGTLFTTPEQRAQLDSAMVAAHSPHMTSDNSEPLAAVNMQSIRLDGILVSSRGKKELWINGQPTSSGTPTGIQQALIGNHGRATIHLDHASTSHSMKPGQLYLPATGEIRETYRNDARSTEE